VSPLIKLLVRIKPWLSSAHRPRSAGVLLTMAAVLLLGFALRTYHLDAKDIWVDEAHPWWFASLPILESVRLGLAGGPINSGADPLYNIVLHYWIRLSGDTLYGLRYLSAALNLLGVAYLGRVAARGFGWRAGRVALLVGAVAPIWVFYSQEMRPYAFTPALMLVMVEAVIRISRSDGLRGWPWVVLAVGEALSIYTHGFMVFAVVGVNLWIGVLWLRRLRTPGKWLWLRDWVISQLALLLILSPVLSLLLARAGGIRNPFATSLDPVAFANMLWAYFMGIPWEDVADPIPLRLWVALLLIVVGLGLAVALRRDGERRLADLIWLVLGLSLVMMVYDWRDPSFHPRYAIFITGPLFLAVGVIGAKTWQASQPGRWLSVALLMTLIVVAMTSIADLYTGRYRGYRHPAALSVSSAIKAGFGPADGVVVVAPHDFTLAYYGHGAAPLAFSRFDEGIEQPVDLLAFIQGKDRIGLLRNTNEHSDSRRILPFYLDRYGALVKRQYFEGYDLSTYRLDPGAQPQLAAFTPVSFDWGAIRLEGVSAASGDSVTVALQWRVPPGVRLDKRYAAALRLTDPLTNWDLGETDTLLYSERGLPSDWWSMDERTTQYFVLPLLPGTPPIDVDMLLTVYDQASGQPLDVRDVAGAPAGQQARLGSVHLGPAPDGWAYDDDQRPWQLMPLKSNLLSGVLVDQPSVAPGGALGVTLGWALSPADPAVKTARLELRQNDTLLAEDDGPPLEGRPPAQVAPGKAWLDRRQMRVSKDAQSGPAVLILIAGDQRIHLADVDISGIARLTEKPTIENPLEATFGNTIKLLGYRIDLPRPLTSSDPLPLTLYWQALADGAPGADYKVFTQILGADGRLVGQHDGVPVGESRPFSGWLSGEYVIDEHPMRFNGPYQGLAHIQVGLYDPITLQRILTADGKDAVLLPLELQVDLSN
jgi:Dolichyl-phosphate-mannose-protein mannosyltransferase